MLLRRLMNSPCSLLHTADRLRRNNSQILFLPLFVHKLTVEVFVCVFNSVYSFALSSIIIHSFKMFSILYIASLKFIFAKKKNNRLTSKKIVKGNIKISGIKLEFSNEEEYIIAPQKNTKNKKHSNKNIVGRR